MLAVEVQKLTRDYLPLEQTIESVLEITAKFRERERGERNVFPSVYDFVGDEDDSLP